jgi:hypothetical protein
VCRSWMTRDVSEAVCGGGGGAERQAGLEEMTTSAYDYCLMDPRRGRSVNMMQLPLCWGTFGHLYSIV